MKAKCRSCAFYRDYDSEFAEDDRCARPPGYKTTPTADACMFYAKKGKKVAKATSKAKPQICTNCDCVFEGNRYTLEGKEGYICLECYENLSQPETPKRVVCVNCGRKFKTTLAVRRGEEPVCFVCRKKAETPTPEQDAYFTCCDCGKVSGVTYKVPGIEGRMCFACVERLKKDRPTVMSVAKVEKVSLSEEICAVCNELIDGGRFEISGIDGVVCFGCNNDHLDAEIEKNLKTENAIHERYLVVEGRGAWPCANVYTHDFSDRENALKFMGRFRPDTCKMFRVSSTAPITLEELSLGYAIKVVSTHEMKEPK